MKGATANPLRGFAVCAFISRPHLPGGIPGSGRGERGSPCPAPPKQAKRIQGAEKGMKRKKGRATPVQSLAVNAALPTARGGGLAYGGGGAGCLGGGLCEC